MCPVTDLTGASEWHDDCSAFSLLVMIKGPDLLVMVEDPVVEVACAPCTIRRLHTSAIHRLHHVQYVDCTQVQYVDCIMYSTSTALKCNMLTTNVH